jgi:hypothetical protein
LIIRRYLLVEVQKCNIIAPVPLENGNAGVVAGGFDCEREEITALGIAVDWKMEAPDEKT